MSRVILHCDLNSFYASVELLSHPELRDLPVAVCGDPASRKGIILAKNEPAKHYGVKTAETIWRSMHLVGGDPKAIADGIRQRVRQELGLTLSVGVSFNKVFAKLGSDYKKPDATTVISPENWQSIVWPLPVGNLLFAGHKFSYFFTLKSPKTYFAKT